MWVVAGVWGVVGWGRVGWAAVGGWGGGGEAAWLVLWWASGVVEGGVCWVVGGCVGGGWGGVWFVRGVWCVGVVSFGVVGLLGGVTLVVVRWVVVWCQVSAVRVAMWVGRCGRRVVAMWWRVFS